LSPFTLLDGWLAPAPDPRRVAWLGAHHYAHRGLHDGMWKGPVLENGLPAFRAAIEAGHGMECDVQQSADGRAMVFHDFTLDRLTARSGRVDALGGTELARTALNGANGTIPELPELLAMIGGRVPLLIEVKLEDGRPGPLCLAVRRALEGYTGPAAVMSFDARVGDWFRRNAPHVVRGLVVTEQGEGQRKKFWGRIKRRRDLWSAKPDFLAYDIRDLPSRFAGAQRRRGLPVLTWTVRTEEQRAPAARHADAPIFETAPAQGDGEAR